ncbi:amino acid adenylation domain-containing protein [Pseudochelatococcus sp. G4_1912]|uniref:amino acid adenylation domain-containing protein n=1 Tax=Pseudochelatococcus sp. G4_1912 TaxID=3114288 RepID=UPI0039C6EAC2
MQTTTKAQTRPLLQAQEGLWFAQTLDPENPILNTGQIVTLKGPLNVAAFQNAVERALREAPALSARFIDGPDGPAQIISDAAPATLTVIDLTGEADPQQAALAHIARDMATPRDPTRDQLVTEELLILGPQLHVWSQTIHHLVIDGYGTALLNHRIAALYNETVTANTAQDTEFGSFFDLIAEDETYVGSARHDKDRRYWNDLFADKPPVISMATGEATSAHSFHRLRLDIPSITTRAITQRATDAGLAWPDLVTTLTGAFIGRHTGASETIIGVPHMGRLGSVSARVPAMVMNVLPVRLRFDDHAPLNTIAAAVARQLTSARRHGRYRSEQLRRDLGLLGKDRRLYGPLVNILPFDMSFALHGVETALEVPGAGAVDDLTFTMRADASGETMRLELDANPALYSQQQTEAIGHRLVHFLHAASQAECLAAVPTLSPQEETQWREAQTATIHPVEETTLAHLLSRQAAATPDALALIEGDLRWSYADLEHETASLARRLAAKGVRPGDIVAVALPRSRALVLTLLASIRIGAAYLPLDTEHPRKRLAHIIQSAKPRIIITTQALSSALPEDAPLFAIDHPVPDDDCPPPFHTPAPEDAAYIIYTSGSTGVPKGVVIEHRAIVNRLLWMAAHYGIGTGDRILQKTPATFDVSVWELFLPFITGAALVIAPPDAHKDPLALTQIVRQHAITTIHFVPSMLALFLDEPSACGLAIQRVFVSGEELPAKLRDRFHTLIKGELHNLYGPTEAAVDVSYWPASSTDHSQPVPIGFPVWNTRLYVLDAHFRPLPANVIGELYLAGRQLARGYLGQPDLTHERFITDPFFPSERMYRTGDLAMVRDDGAIVYLGRTDHQIKLRGLRIELGEIETALHAQSTVAQAVVDARSDGAGGKRLVAYVVAKPDEGLDHEALRTSIASRIPAYMVPSAFVTLDRLPLSANGKLDRKALPDPTLTATTGRAPHSKTEQCIARLFAECLKLDIATISAEDDFFNLGGHSLLAAKLMQRVREEWASELGEVTLGLGIVFTDPTVARLATRIEVACKPQTPLDYDGLANDGLGPLVQLSQGDPTSALFCIHPAGGISWCYAGLARALAPAHMVFGLQARGLDTQAPAPISIESIAADYIAQIRAIIPEGPIHLAGWSVGGIIAHAMAVQLAASGAPQGVLALLDAYPSDSWRAQSDPSEDISLKALVQIAGRDVSELGAQGLTRENVMAFLRDINHPLGLLSDRALTGIIGVVAANNRLVRTHQHGFYAGETLYFRAALDHAGTNLTPQLWTPYIQTLTVHDVPALHAHLTGPKAITHIAPVIADKLRQF